MAIDIKSMYQSIKSSQCDDIQKDTNILNLMFDHREILVKKNKDYIFNDYFSVVCNKTVDLRDYNDFENAYSSSINTMLTKGIKGQLILLINYVITPSVFYLTDDELNADHEYMIKLLNYLKSSLTNFHSTVSDTYGICNNVTNLHQCFRPNYSYINSYNGKNNKMIYVLIYEIMVLLLPKTFVLKLVPDVKYDMITTVRKKKILFVGNYILQNHSVHKTHYNFLRSMCENKYFDTKVLTFGMTEMYCPDIDKENIINIVHGTSLTFIEDVAVHIAGMAFDVIVYTEIGMNQLFRLLSFYRLAPVQCNTYGHSETSGIAQIDYYISSCYYENKNSQDNYSEKLIMLPSLCTCYDFPHKVRENKTVVTDLTSEVNRLSAEVLNILNFPKNSVIYSCINMYFKFTSSFLRVIKRIFDNDENAVLVLLDYNELSDDFKEYILSIGRQYISRIRIIARVNYLIYMTYLNISDIVIENFNFGGCNTSIQALSLGKIVLTITGNKLCNSFTQGFYKKMIECSDTPATLKITDFVFNTEDEFVEHAVAYGKNAELRKNTENIIKQLANQFLYEDEKSINDWNLLMMNL